MRNFATVLMVLIYSFASAQTKIPITSNYIYQDNSQQDRADKLIDGNTAINYSPSGPKLYKQHEIVFDLFNWRASVSSVKIYIGNPDTCTVKIIVVGKNFVEKEIGTFKGGANQSFTYQSGFNGQVGRVVLRTSSKNYQFGSEVELYGTFTVPGAAKLKERRPLGWMAGANGHSWDLMNDAKLNVIKSLGIQTGALRIYDYPYQVTDTLGKWKFEGELVTDRYSTDSAFAMLHRWSANIFTWKGLSGQYADQQKSWNVIDNFPNKYIRGTVVGYNDYGSWGQVTMTITATNGTDEQNYGKWFVYKNGTEVNVTETPENFSNTLVGQNRTYNVGGGLGFASGEVLTFYKSQSSVNPIFFADKDLPNRNTYAAHLRSAKGTFVYASRGGSNANVPDYPVQTGQRMLKGYKIYNAIESSNEPNAWWSNTDGFWNGKTLFYHWSMAYDGNKGAYPNTGVKHADPTIIYAASGLATDKPDQILSAIETARELRGNRADGNIDVPFDVVNVHIYSSAEGQYGYGNSGGLPPEQGMIPQVKNIVWTVENFAPTTQVWVTEWGWDQHPNSPLRAGQFGSYDREAVGGFWMVRAMLGMAAVGVDRSTYYRLAQDWPETGSNNSSLQFATMRLMSQPNDNDPTIIVRTRQGDYMAQYNEFRNYVYYDSIATALPGVYAYRYKNQSNDSLVIALWSEEVTSIAGGNASFTERTGTLTLPINAGSYKTRQFLDDGSSIMSSTTGTSTGTVPFTYAAKPIFIQTILPPRPKGAKGTQAAATQRTAAEDYVASSAATVNQTYVFNSVGQLLYNKKVDDINSFKRTLPPGLYIIWRNNKAEKFRAINNF
jgi:hypothetical protein